MLVLGLQKSRQRPVCDEYIPVREHTLICNSWDAMWIPVPGPEMSSLPVHWSHLHGDIRAQQYHLKQRGRHLWAQRAAHHAGSAFHVQLVLPYAEVILLTQVRESCAARPLGVEAGESATASPAQPDRPRNTGDPWKTERPGCDSYSCPCTPGTPQTRPSLPVFLVSAT